MIKVKTIAYKRELMNHPQGQRTFTCNCKDEEAVDLFFANLKRLGYKSVVTEYRDAKDNHIQPDSIR